MPTSARQGKNGNACHMHSNSALVSLGILGASWWGERTYLYHLRLPQKLHLEMPLKGLLKHNHGEFHQLEARAEPEFAPLSNWQRQMPWKRKQAPSIYAMQRVASWGGSISCTAAQEPHSLRDPGFVSSQRICCDFFRLPFPYHFLKVSMDLT